MTQCMTEDEALRLGSSYDQFKENEKCCVRVGWFLLQSWGILMVIANFEILTSRQEIKLRLFIRL